MKYKGKLAIEKEGISAEEMKIKMNLVSWNYLA